MDARSEAVSRKGIKMNFVAQPTGPSSARPVSCWAPPFFVPQEVTKISCKKTIAMLWSSLLFGYRSTRIEVRILADISNGVHLKTIGHIARSADSHRNSLGGHIWLTVYDAVIRAREGNPFPAMRTYIDQQTKWKLCKTLSRETEMTRQQISEHVVLPREKVEEILSEEILGDQIVNPTYGE